MKRVCFRHLSRITLFACLVMTLPLLMQCALAKDSNEALISVEYIGINPDINAIDANSPEILGDVLQSIASQKLGTDPALENAFLLRPSKALILEYFAVTDLSPEGKPLLGERLAYSKLQKGDVFLFRHLVPEGMPNLMLCIQDNTEPLCWAPQFSGEDESLILSPGFVLFEKNKDTTSQ